MDRFSVCLAETLHLEGGYSNDAVDPGGPTMSGIIQKEYDAYRERHNLIRQSVRLITKEEFTAIYRENYWLPSRSGEMPPGIDLCNWDFSVNSGVGQAAKSLQRVLGISIDGHIGSLTMDAVARAEQSQLIHDYMNERRRFLKGLSTFWHFGKGWTARCDEIEASALAAVSNMPRSFHAADGALGTLPRDPDERSATQGRAPAESPAPPVAAQASAAAGGAVSFFAVAPDILAKATVGGKLTAGTLALAVLTSPWFWAGAASLFAAVMFYLHRRRVAA